MKAVSAKASFSDKARKLFATSTSSREISAGVVSARSKAGGSFKIGQYTIRTDAPSKKK